MKRFCLLLLCMLLTGCGGELPTMPEGWEPFSLNELGGRRSAELCYELEPSDDYGALYPFAVILSAVHTQTWMGDVVPGTSSMPLNLFGLVDAEGRVVVDPAYSYVMRLKNNVLVLSEASAGTYEDNRFMLAAGDGSWVSAERYNYAGSHPEGIVVHQSRRVSEDEWQYLSGLVGYDGEVLLPLTTGGMHLPSPSEPEPEPDLSGLADYDGEVSIYGSLGNMSDFSGEYLYITSEEPRLTQVTDREGVPILSELYEQVCAVGGGMFSVVKGRYSGIVDSEGQWLFRKSLLDYLPD